MGNLWGQGWIEGINDGFLCNVCKKEASNLNYKFTNFR